MSSSSDMKNMYQPNVKAEQPDYRGPQYADSPTGGIVSRDSNYLGVSRDAYGNELAADRVMHGNSTPMEGGFNWQGNQYSTDFNAGYGPPYGVAVSPPEGVEKIAVDNSRADRGQES